MKKVDYETYEPESFLKGAKEYYLAGSNLLSQFKTFESPVYFLFTHSIELSLKAYLNITGPYKKKTHSLKILYEQARKNGFPYSIEIKNLIELLESENELHGYRYFIFKSTVKPEIYYLAEGAGDILSFVNTILNTLERPDSKKGVVGKLTFSKAFESSKGLHYSAPIIFPNN